MWQNKFLTVIQWNLSNLDTNRAGGVLNSEVENHARVALGVGKVYFLERCLQFNGVLIEVQYS